MLCFSLLLGLLGTICSVQAQLTTTTSAAGAIHTVLVAGGNGHSFLPNTTTAKVGDKIVFEFIAPGHSVVKASYGEPCIPYETLNRGEPTFFSGFFNGSDTTSQNPPTWNLTITDTNPIFFYCSKPGSCLDNYMIGAINPNSTQSLESQASFIGTTDKIMLQPGEPIPEEGTGVATTSSNSGTSSATASPTSTSGSNHHSSGTTLSAGAIAGIAVAGVVILALASALFWFMGRHRTLKSQSNSAVGRWVDNTASSYPPSSVGGGPRPPSYVPNGDHLEAGKQWEGQPYYSAAPMMQIQELGAAEAVELDDGDRARARQRHGEEQEVYSFLLPK